MLQCSKMLEKQATRPQRAAVIKPWMLCYAHIVAYRIQIKVKHFYSDQMGVFIGACAQQSIQSLEQDRGLLKHLKTCLQPATPPTHLPPLPLKIVHNFEVLEFCRVDKFQNFGPFCLVRVYSILPAYISLVYFL